MDFEVICVRKIVAPLGITFQTQIKILEPHFTIYEKNEIPHGITINFFWNHNFIYKLE